MTEHILAAKELAAELGVTEIDLQAIAHERRLPFSFSTAFGFFCHRRDLPTWKAAMEPRPNQEGCCGV
jgi:hypothetical protein